MEELAKVRRIVDRLAPDAAVESLLVLDASQGRTACVRRWPSQKRLASLVLCSPSSMAQPAVAWRLPWPREQPADPIHRRGEGLRDLRPFNSFEFVEALLARA